MALFDSLAAEGFELEFRSHAAAIIEKDFPAALGDLESALLSLAIPIQEIVGSGGGEARGTQRLRRAFNERGWSKLCFEIKKSINGVEREATSHEVDHVKGFPAGTLALEIEWNNKDPFFDRDLENFKRLHAEGAISVGIVVTRGSSLHQGMRELVGGFAADNAIQSFGDLERLDIHLTRRQRAAIQRRAERSPADVAAAWAKNFVADKYGEATTHWAKLKVRIDRGVGNPCPLLLIGLPRSIVTP